MPIWIQLQLKINESQNNCQKSRSYDSVNHMNKRFLLTILIIIAASIFLIGGYFVASRFGFLPKRTVEYAQPISELEQAEKVKPEITVETSLGDGIENIPSAIENSGGAQQVDNKQQPKADTKEAFENKKQEAAATEKNVEPAGGPGKIVDKFVSWGFQKSASRNIKAIILHTTYNALGGDVFDFEKVVQEWKEAGVSPHYAIDRDGAIYHLVADQNIAWHAGVSSLPDGTKDVNGVSIGVEIVNDKSSKFTDAQYSALNSLIASLKKKNEIKYILGHDEIAPGRKTDPWGIEWSKVVK